MYIFSPIFPNAWRGVSKIGENIYIYICVHIPRQTERGTRAPTHVHAQIKRQAQTAELGEKKKQTDVEQIYWGGGGNRPLKVAELVEVVADD
jgi:ACT domain-containing protein